MTLRTTATMVALFLIPSVALAGAQVSTHKKETKKGANYYAGNAAIDGKLDTAWVVPGESPNRGEWIMIDVPKGEIDKIEIYPGWGKSDETYTDHPRVKRLQVEVLCCAGGEQMETTGTAHVDVEDKAELQLIDMDNLVVGNDLFGGAVKISVVDIYDGQDFPNLAVSEIMIHMTEQDAPASITDSSAESDPKHMVFDITDGNAKTYWVTPSAGAHFTWFAEGSGLSSITVDHVAGHDRIKKAKLTVDGEREYEIELADEKSQLVRVPSTFGHTGVSTFDGVKLEVLEVYGDKGTIAISEINAKSTFYEGL